MTELMRIVGLASFGAPDVMRIDHAPVPTPTRTEVLIRVAAAGVNPIDWYTREGGASAPLLGTPARLGWEVAGVVEAAGPGVTIWKPGDRVMGLVRFPYPAGAYAEFMTAPARQLAPVGVNVDMVAAAAVPFAGLTAWQALHDVAAVVPGERVMVNGANGGVGHLAVQIAAALGARVTAVARSDVHTFVRSLGAFDVIDYSESLGREPHDVIIDVVGGEHQVELVRLIKPGGRLVLLADEPTEATLRDATRLGVRVEAPIVEPDGHGLRELSAMVTSGLVRPRVGHSTELADVVRAHRLGECRAVREGKIVLTIRQSRAG